MNLAPSEAASFSAAPRSAIAVLVASTTVMWQFGQIAETTSMLAASVASQFADVGGKVLVPVWLTCLKHPSATVHGESPYWER